MSDWKKFIREEAKNEVNEINDPVLELSREERLLQSLTDAYIDQNKDYIEPPVFLGILDSFTGNVERVCTPANISAITGKAKAKKSFLQSMFIASAVKNGVLQNKITSALPENKNGVLVFDTEQSQFDVSRVVNRISNLIGYKPDNLAVFSLRGMLANDIVDLVEFALTIYPDTGMLFIDQVADLAKSINSEEEAVKIVRWLERLTKEKDIHICCVIHQNKGDNYASGWLGSQVMKKAETVISVEKEDRDKSISHVKPFASRSKDFDEFSFSINERGIPIILGEEERKQYEESEF